MGLGTGRCGEGPAILLTHLCAAQVMGGGRGSLTSDGQTSWDSGCPVPPSTCTSHSLPESSVPSTTGCPAQSAPVSVWRKGMGEGKGRGQEASLCWGAWVPMAPHPKRDPRSSGEGSQAGGSLVQPQKVVWERAPGNFLEGSWSLQDQIDLYKNNQCYSIGCACGTGVGAGSLGSGHDCSFQGAIRPGPEKNPRDFGNSAPGHLLCVTGLQADAKALRWQCWPVPPISRRFLPVL